MTEKRGDLRAYAMLTIVMLLWAGNSIVGRAVREDVLPFTLAFVRWTGAFLILLPFAAATLRRERAAIARGWAPILLLGLLGVGAFNALLYSGLRETAASNALLLQASIPTLVMLFDRLFFGVRARLWQLIGVLLSTIGVMVIVFQGDIARAAQLHLGHGDVLVLCSVLAWSLYTVFLRLRPPISAIAFITVTFAVGVVTMAPLAFMEWHGGAKVVLTPGVLGAFAYVAVLPSIVAYFIFNAAVVRIGPASAGQAITLMPLFGALLSALLLGETLHGYHAAGMMLILAGIVISLRGRPVRKAQVSTGTSPASPLERGA